MPLPVDPSPRRLHNLQALWVISEIHDDRTTFATYASSLHQRASLEEEKDRLSTLIVTINQVITYLALNLPDPHQNPALQAACQQKINTEKRITEIVSTNDKSLIQNLVMTTYLYAHTGEGADTNQ